MNKAGTDAAYPSRKLSKIEQIKLSVRDSKGVVVNDNESIGSDNLSRDYKVSRRPVGDLILHRSSINR